ncbi:MAG: hypothetical protein C0469_05715 [Cyanobacteria bacterium DS2.3.42]|nr:hypothetical protein [Cyanobacteria bacterium DS2.3.42]
MLINEESTVQEILEVCPEAVKVFDEHGVNIGLECPESILETALSICEGMCHIDDLEGLIKDLQEFTGK